MSTIFLDPAQMDATAGHIGDHVRELTTLVAELESACSASVPAGLAVWLAEELHDIAVTAQLIALVYSLAALDTAQRAQQIQADQSLATATPTFADAPLVGGSVLGTATLAPSTFGSGQGTGFLLGASGPNTPLGGYTPIASAGFSSLPLFDIPGYASTNTMLLSTPGRTYLGNNIYEGSGITGSFHAVLPDPGRDY